MSAALAIVEQNTSRLHSQMWQPVVDALQLGATLDEVADAMCETTEWVAARLIDWSDHREATGRQTEDEGDRLRELLHAAGGPAPIPADAPIGYCLEVAAS
jgi:hypothetical protein